MVGDDYRNGAPVFGLPVVKQLPAQAAQRTDFAEQGVGRCSSEQNDQARLQEDDLATQIRGASGNFARLRSPIMGRATFDGVGNVHVVATAQVNRRQHGIQQATGGTDKGLSACVFFGTRSFADEQPVGFDVTDARNSLLPLFT